MGIRVFEFPEYRLNLHVVSGVITPDILLKHFNEELDVTAPQWITYFDRTADFSQVDIAHFPKLRSAVISAEQRRVGKSLPILMVSESRSADQFLKFWRTYNIDYPHEIEFPHELVMIGSLEAACDRLGLPLEAYDKLAAAIRRPEGARLAERPGSGAVA
jgi:hypothetical protein